MLVAVVPPLLGLRRQASRTTVGGRRRRRRLAVAQAADRSASGVRRRREGPPAARRRRRAPRSTTATSTPCSSTRGLRSPRRSPTTTLVGIVADRRPRGPAGRGAAAGRARAHAEVQHALNPPPLKVTTVEPVDPERDRKGDVRVRRRARALRAAADVRLPARERGGGGEGLARRRGAARDDPAARPAGRQDHRPRRARLRPAAGDRGGRGWRRRPRRGRSTSTATSSAPPRWRSAGSCSATRSTPACSPARARSCRARRSCSPR